MGRRRGEGGDGPAFGPGDGMQGREVLGERIARAARTRAASARALAAIAEGAEDTYKRT